MKFPIWDSMQVNILADVIIPLASVIGEYLTDDGIFVASGISESKIDAVKIAVMQAGFTIIDEERENEWFAIAAVRK